MQSDCSAVTPAAVPLKQEGRVLPSGVKVEPWEAGTGRATRDPGSILKSFHETLAGRLSECLAAYLGSELNLMLQSTEYVHYREFARELPNICYLASCRIDPDGTPLILQWDAALAYAMVDLLFGGHGKIAGMDREISEIEGRVLERIGGIICEVLQVQWQIIAVKPQFEGSQPRSQLERLMPPNKTMFVLRFDVMIAENQSRLCIAVDAIVAQRLLRAIAASNSPQQSRPKQAVNEAKNHALAVPFELEMRMQDLRVAASRIMNLCVGDVIVFARRADSNATATIEDIKLFEARIARLHNRRAGQVRAVLPGGGKD